MMPFMTCSARLTTYVAIIAAYFSKGHGIILSHVMGFVIALHRHILPKRVECWAKYPAGDAGACIEMAL